MKVVLPQRINHLLNAFPPEADLAIKVAHCFDQTAQSYLARPFGKNLQEISTAYADSPGFGDYLVTSDPLFRKSCRQRHTRGLDVQKFLSGLSPAAPPVWESAPEILARIDVDQLSCYFDRIWNLWVTMQPTLHRILVGCLNQYIPEYRKLSGDQKSPDRYIRYQLLQLCVEWQRVLHTRLFRPYFLFRFKGQPLSSAQFS